MKANYPTAAIRRSGHSVFIDAEFGRKQFGHFQIAGKQKAALCRLLNESMRPPKGGDGTVQVTLF
jgi:hypothetical protein